LEEVEFGLCEQFGVGCCFDFVGGEEIGEDGDALFGFVTLYLTDIGGDAGEHERIQFGLEFGEDLVESEEIVGSGITAVVTVGTGRCELEDGDGELVVEFGLEERCDGGVEFGLVGVLR